MHFLTLLFLAASTAQHVAALDRAILAKYQAMANMGMIPGGSSASQAQILPRQSGNSTENIEPEFVQMPLDHFTDGSGGSTFPNRFWVAESGYKKGGPVFIYDNGESDASPSALFLLQDSTSFFKQMVDQFGGIGIVWEHRFYGNSTPYNISQTTPAKDFQHLTSEQALADVVYFASNFSCKNMPDVDLSPTGSPWVFVGGSYPGMRAALMRKFYPKTIVASFASSAPVQASLDMSFYFEAVWEGMTDYGWSNCTNDIQAAIRSMDTIMENPAAAADLKEKFLGPEARNSSNAGMADAIATIFYLYQSYGVDGGPEGLRSFCDWISTDPKRNTTSPAEGFAASRGANYTIDRWATWPNLCKQSTTTS